MYPMSIFDTRSLSFTKDEVVTNELSEVRNLVEGYIKGTVAEEVLKPRRLLQGVYGQRQSDVQMLRIKVPGGNLNFAQLEVIKNIAEEFTNGVLHITTRQDIQLHFIPLEHIPSILEKMADVGLTSREACGNSVRNVTSSPFSGSLRNEVFDVVPAVNATTKFFLRNKDTQAFPRKFKIAFSESFEDIAVTGMHDLGAIAKESSDGTLGFKVVVGGGLGSQPFPAQVYSEFISSKDLLLHFLAIARVFDRCGDRQKRMKARIKFLIKKMGIENFYEECQKEIISILEEKIVVPIISVRKDLVEEFKTENPFSEENSSEKDKFYWFKKNIFPTKRKHEWMIMVQCPLGDISSEHTTLLINKLAKWQKDYKGNEFITVTDDQNFVIKGLVILEDKLKSFFTEVYDFLDAMNFAEIGYHDMSDPVSCPGTSSCNLGITHSKGLARALREKFDGLFAYDSRFDGSTIQMSGCPNSCGRHHLGTLGFFGRSDKISDEQQAPAYNVMIGGANLGDGRIIIAKKCTKILAKRIPDFIESLIQKYETSSNQDELFNKFCARLDKNEINELINSFDKESKLIEKSEKVEYDWGEDKPYVMEFGEGECGV